ncbi:hypothetical protein Mettu_0536 [Methylobacter tundripaludum SV96]|uniref:Uncharacterized protein n=1 Tax=Methylobacter tundripaludum (strain ATCC BAA-1195 / DSM 17260 / SV96) TaxID=697282 RepID=G3IVM0_METTV|nr:hypothetical protein Mettu_0536 [Methylobacter tundripaludum SV96]
MHYRYRGLKIFTPLRSVSKFFSVGVQNSFHFFPQFSDDFPVKTNRVINKSNNLEIMNWQILTLFYSCFDSTPTSTTKHISYSIRVLTDSLSFLHKVLMLSRV